MDRRNLGCMNLVQPIIYIMAAIFCAVMRAVVIELFSCVIFTFIVIG